MNCCGSWGHKESDMTERLNWTESAFLQDSNPSFMAWDTRLVQRLSQNTSCGWGAWCHSLTSETFLSFINRLLVTSPWRRKRHPTPVSLPGESHGRRSLVGYSPRGHKESDTTERFFTFTLLESAIQSEVSQKEKQRGRDGWMASSTQRTWVWASSRRWWRRREPGVLQSMGS